MVTIEDIIEELVGDIEDEYDEEDESIQKLDENTYIFEGVTDIEDVENALGISFPEGDYDTLAGFVISRLGFVPTQNDIDAVVDYSGVVFTVLEVEDRRIEKIKASKSPTLSEND